MHRHHRHRLHPLTLGVPENIATALRDIADDRGLSLASTVRSVLIEYIEYRDQKKSGRVFTDPFSKRKRDLFAGSFLPYFDDDQEKR